MPRPAVSGATVSTQKAQTQPTHPSGHTLTFYADHAIWDENSSVFIKPEDVIGYNKF